MSQYIWHNGKVLHAVEAGNISPLDRGFTLGDALFETLPCFNGVALWQKEHLARLATSAEALKINFDMQACQAMLAHGAEHAPQVPQILRLQLSRGIGARGLHLPEPQHQTLSMSISPWSPSLLQGNVHLCISSIKRNITSPTSQHKTANYLDNIMALEGAKQRGFDDALFLNEDGFATCATTANLFAIRGDTLLTPPLKDGVLAGIMRMQLLCAAKSLGLKRKVQSLNMNDLNACDVLFLTNSARFMLPVAQLEKHIFDGAIANPIFASLRNWLYKTVHQETGYDLRGASQ